MKKRIECLVFDFAFRDTLFLYKLDYVNFDVKF